MIARAKAMVPVLRERAARTEALRRVPDETIADFHNAGFFRVLQRGKSRAPHLGETTNASNRARASLERASPG
jgi:hypothetical protein